MRDLLPTLTGDVTRPDDPGWDAARQAWNLVADQRPAAVVHAESAEDVAATVAYARRAGLRVAVQGTGHGAPAMAPLDGTVLLRTSRMTDVTVDPAAGTAWVQAGATWHDVVGPAAEHGLAALHGSSGTVGVAGYSLGGGLGWLARSEGLAANAILALDVVTADGEARRVDAEHEPELFWALRGGGGAHAIVTALQLRLVPLREAYAGQLLWPMAQAAEVVQAYRAWTADLPETVTSTVKLVRYPPLPDVPEPLRGGAFAAITLVAVGDVTRGDDLVAPLRAVGPPLLDTLAVVPAAQLASIAGDPPGPLPGLGGDGVLLGPLDEAAIAAYVALAGPDAPVPLIHLELRHLGGALARGDAGHGALDRLEGAFLLYGVGVPVTPEVGAAVLATLDGARERMAPYAASSPPRSLLSFDERSPGIRASFPADVADRLVRVKAAYDPDGLLVGNHVVA